MNINIPFCEICFSSPCKCALFSTETFLPLSNIVGQHILSPIDALHASNKVINEVEKRLLYINSTTEQVCEDVYTAEDALHEHPVKSINSEPKFTPLQIRLDGGIAKFSKELEVYVSEVNAWMKWARLQMKIREEIINRTNIMYKKIQQLEQENQELNLENQRLTFLTSEVKD